MTYDRKKPSLSGLEQLDKSTDSSDFTYTQPRPDARTEPREEYLTPPSAMDELDEPPPIPKNEKKKPTVDTIFRRNAARMARQKAKETQATKARLESTVSGNKAGLSKASAANHADDRPSTPTRQESESVEKEKDDSESISDTPPLPVVESTPLSSELRDALKKGLKKIDEKSLDAVREKYKQLLRTETNITTLKKCIELSKIPAYLNINISPRVAKAQQEELNQVVKKSIRDLQNTVMKAMLDARKSERDDIKANTATEIDERSNKVDDLINLYLENDLIIPASFRSEANAEFEKKAKDTYLSLKTQSILRKTTLAEKAQSKKTADAEENIRRILEHPNGNTTSCNNNDADSADKETKKRLGKIEKTLRSMEKSINSLEKKLQAKPTNPDPVSGGKKDTVRPKGDAHQDAKDTRTRAQRGRGGRRRGRALGHNQTK